MNESWSECVTMLDRISETPSDTWWQFHSTELAILLFPEAESCGRPFFSVLKERFVSEDEPVDGEDALGLIGAHVADRRSSFLVSAFGRTAAVSSKCLLDMLRRIS